MFRIIERSKKGDQVGGFGPPTIHWVGANYQYERERQREREIGGAKGW